LQALWRKGVSAYSAKFICVRSLAMVSAQPSRCLLRSGPRGPFAWASKLASWIRPCPDQHESAVLPPPVQAGLASLPLEQLPISRVPSILAGDVSCTSVRMRRQRARHRRRGGPDRIFRELLTPGFAKRRLL
jgi:hypothetical protein